MISKRNVHSFRQLISRSRLLIAIAIIGVTTGLTLFVPRFAFESYERSTVKSAANAILSFQNAYKSEFGVYCVDQNLIRKNLLTIDELEYVLSRDESPLVDKLQSPNLNDPFVSESNFNILIILKSKKFNRTSVWKVAPETIPIRLLTEEISK